MSKLGETLGAIASCEAVPNFNIKFSIKEPNVVSEQLLASAVENAKLKAEILAKSAGVTLGAIQRIDYNWSELHLFSDTDLDMDENIEYSPKIKSISIDIHPDEIKVSDTATIVWAIE